MMIIAIDVGGTKISAALFEHGKIIQSRKTDSTIHKDLANLANYLIDFCYDWIELADNIAIACTGQVGATEVNFLSAGQSLPLKQQLEVVTKLPVIILNDAAAAAWAEYCLGSARLDNTLVYITVSTGIGGGMVQNGQLVTSNDGFCGHLGHVSVPNFGWEPIKCHCGRINCVEAISSGSAIAKQASQILGKQVSCREVFDSYLTHPKIMQLIDRSVDAVVDLIASIKAVTGTTTIVLGGSVGLTSVFKEKVELKISRLPAKYRVQTESPCLGADADLIGAALYADSCSKLV